MSCQPTQSFGWTQLAGRPALVCHPLETIAAHLFTTRQWLLGAPRRGRDTGRAWNEISEALKIDSRRLVRARQVHGQDVLIVGSLQPTNGTPSRLSSEAQVPSATPAPPTADILITAEPGTAVAVQVADCVPLLIADRRTQAVAAAHAGWRGLALRVPEAAVAALHREFQSRPADLLAAVGPSIGACCYQVGADVREHFEGAGFSPQAIGRWFRSRPVESPLNALNVTLRQSTDAQHWFLDTWTVARDQLEDAGVPRGQIFGADLCTASHGDRFCSFRREGTETGRIAGVIAAGPPGP